MGKIVSPKHQTLEDISLFSFPGAKIGVLGLNDSGKSTVFEVVAGPDKDIEGEAMPIPNLNTGCLPQELQPDLVKTVRGEVESGLGEAMDAQGQLEAIYAVYAEGGADLGKPAEEQARLEAIIAASFGDSVEL